MNKYVMGVTVAVGCAGVALAGGCSSNSTGAPSASGELCNPMGCFGLDGGPLTGFPSGPQPTFRATVVAPTAPPPISGGTLLVTQDGKLAVASDPDRDAVYIVDLGSYTLLTTVALQKGDEPGRLAEDGAGRVHVALRGSGMLASIDLASGTVVARRQGCPAPRGVAYDATNDSVFLACATGELVTLPAAGGPATASLHVERDLRDVLVANGQLSVTSFRSAEVLRMGPGGVVASRVAMPSPDMSFNPHVAWRAVAEPSGAIVAVHQAESVNSIDTTMPGGYGGGGGPIINPVSGIFFDDAGFPTITSPGSGSSSGTGVEDDSGLLFEGDGGTAPDASPVPLGDFVPTPFASAASAVISVVTVLAPDGSVSLNQRVSGVLPVDVAVARDGSAIAVVTPGSSFTPGLTDLAIVSAHGETDLSVAPNNQPIAVAFDAKGDLLVQTREPATLQWQSRDGTRGASVSLSTITRDDTGHDVFHTQAGAQIACASCHPEGGDDGHVWILDSNKRRTPSLRGTLAGTAPYHWPGDEADLPTLVNDVYTNRMAGAPLQSDQMGALTGWVQTIPRPAAPSWVDATAASKGQALFERSDTACASCHTGSKYTNNQTVDVGTGGAFQVPPLVGVGWRTPLMHDGCAATIGDRFSTCSTAQHGNVKSLSAADIANLTAYLETL
jgi:mono/diheme cytochrome c family protein